jgi:hypothetical protein
MTSRATPTGSPPHSADIPVAAVGPHQLIGQTWELDPRRSAGSIPPHPGPEERGAALSGGGYAPMAFFSSAAMPPA